MTWRKAAVGLSLLTASLMLAACSGAAASSNAHQACQRVEESLTTYKQATAPGTTSEETHALTLKAQSQLLDALRFAAQATSDDGSYNALMTTIQEADRVPEGYLTASLKRECHLVLSGSNLGL